LELWVPAEDLATFNRNITSPIEIVAVFFGRGYKGEIPNQFGLRGKDAGAQFVALTKAFKESMMDFRLEIAANHRAVFLNFPFWQHRDFADHAIEHSEKQRVMKEIENTWHDKIRAPGLPRTVV
jgi:hypothetical protein